MGQRTSFWILGIVASIVLVALLAACQQAAPAAPTAAPKPAAQPTAAPKVDAKAPAPAAGTRHYTFGGGPTGGVYTVIMARFGNLLEKAVPGVKTTVQTTSGTVENLRLLGNGDIQFALGGDDSVYFAYRGEREFQKDGKKYDMIRQIMRGYGSVILFFAPKESSIKSVADFKGKKLAVVAGVTAESHFPLIYPLYGLKKEDFQQTLLGVAEAASALKDGNVDAIVAAAGAPSAGFSDLATSRNIRTFSVEKEKREELMRQHPYYTGIELAKGVYRGVDEPFTAIGTPNILYTDKSVPDDVVYGLVKALDENRAKLGEIHPLASEFVIATALEPQVAPVHPGAEKYYKEKGVIK